MSLAGFYLTRVLSYDFGMCRLIGIGDDFGTIMIKLVDDVEDRRL